MQRTLKIPSYSFEEISQGNERLKIRPKGLSYRLGDILILQEYDNINYKYTGREVRMRIEHIISYLQEAGYIVVSLEPLQD